MLWPMLLPVPLPLMPPTTHPPTHPPQVPTTTCVPCHHTVQSVKKLWEKDVCVSALLYGIHSQGHLGKIKLHLHPFQWMLLSVPFMSMQMVGDTVFKLGMIMCVIGILCVGLKTFFICHFYMCVVGVHVSECLHVCGSMCTCVYVGAYFYMCIACVCRGLKAGVGNHPQFLFELIYWARQVS